MKLTIKRALICLAAYIIFRLIFSPFCGNMFGGVAAMLEINKYSDALYDNVYIQPAAFYVFQTSSIKPEYSMRGISYFPQAKEIRDGSLVHKQRMQFEDDLFLLKKKLPEGMRMQSNFNAYSDTYVVANGKYDPGELQRFDFIAFCIMDENPLQERYDEQFFQTLEYIMGYLQTQHNINGLSVCYCADVSSSDDEPVPLIPLLDVVLQAPPNAILTDFTAQTLSNHAVSVGEPEDAKGGA